MIEKHLASPRLAGDFFGDAGTTSAAFKFEVSLFSLESVVERLSSDDCDVVSSDDEASVMFAKSLLSQSYMCTEKSRH